MFEFVEDQYRHGYVFIEEGIRQYLWFLGARAQVQNPRRRAAPAASAVASNA